MSRVRSTHFLPVFVLFLLLFALFAVPVAAQTSPTLSLPSATVLAGQTVVVPMTYTHGGAVNVISVELKITWTPAVATLVSVARGALLDDSWYMEVSTATAGEATVVLATGMDDLTTSGELLRFTFSGAAAGTTPLTFAQASLNEGDVAATATNGSLRVNRAPDAVNDSYATNEDTPLTVPLATGVKSNDSDPDGDTPLTVALGATNVAHGTLTLNADGSFTYSPALNYNGPDSFTYTLTDPYGASDTASVAITVNAVNDAPVAVAGGPYSVPEGGSVALAGSATDVDGATTFTYEWDLDNNGSFETTGSATPTFSAAGKDGPSTQTVALRVKDAGNATSAVVNATVTINNVAPTAVHGGPYNAVAGGTVQLTGSATDPGGDTLTYAWDLDNNGSFETSGPSPVFSAVGLSDSVVTIKLRVTDDDGAVSTVVQTTVTIGTWPRYTFSGAVLYWKNAKAVTGVSVALSGSATASTTSAAGGAWSFTNILGYNSNYVVTPSYAAAAAGVTAYDAALVLKHAVGLGTLTGGALAAADVNGANGVNATDAVLILTHAVGLNPMPLADGGLVWKFDPTQYSYNQPTSNQPNQNFTAVLLGDVSGNWATLSALAADLPSAMAKIEMSAVDAAGNYTVILRMDSGAALHSAELTMLYDAALVSLVDASAPGGRMVVKNAGTPGMLRLATAGADAVAAGAELLRITLHSADGVAHAPQIVSMQVDEQPAWAAWERSIYLPLVQQ